VKRFLLAVAVVVAAGCTDGSSPSTSGPSDQDPAVGTTSTTAAPGATTEAAAVPPRVPDELPEGVELATVDLDDTELLVAVADNAALRSRGLMFVDSLLDLDGMLFVFEQDAAGGFWMKNTLLPLDIAFFDVDGLIVDTFPMEPCTSAPCPSYSPAGEYRYALEMLAGTMPPAPQRLKLQD
jgi:uncharacterized membrane protein (UPF0127 family)